MAGTPPGYEALHIEFHEWMLTGDESFGSATDGGAGVKALVEALLSENIGVTPYGEVSPYDPDGADEPLEGLETIRDDLVTAVDSYDAAGTWSTNFTAAANAIDGEYDATKINDLVSEFSDKQETLLDARIADYASLFGESLYGSAYIVGVALLEREHTRQTAEFRKELLLNIENRKLELASNVALSTANLEIGNRLQAAAILSDTANTIMAARRQFVSDDIGLKLEDAFWDFRLYEFAGRALSSISGAAVMPRKPNEALEMISTVATSLGAAYPLIAGAYKAISG